MDDSNYYQYRTKLYLNYTFLTSTTAVQAVHFLRSPPACSASTRNQVVVLRSTGGSDRSIDIFTGCCFDRPVLKIQEQVIQDPSTQGSSIQDPFIRDPLIKNPLIQDPSIPKILWSFDIIRFVGPVLCRGGGNRHGPEHATTKLIERGKRNKNEKRV